MTELQKRVAEFARSKIGCGYIYGATGWICSEARRKQQAAQYPEYADKILNVGKKWDGKECYDCAQLVRHAVAAGGGYLPSGANSQYNGAAASWTVKGKIESIGARPDDSPVILYRLDASGKAQHTGVYIGGGEVVDARGTAEGVMRSKLAAYPWTHWGKPLLGVTGVVDWEAQTYPCDSIVRTKTGNGIGLWSGPSTNGTKIKSVPEGSVVTVLEKPAASGFATATFGGPTGCADTQYLYPVDAGAEAQPEETPKSPDENAGAAIGSNMFELKPIRFEAYPAIGQVRIAENLLASDGDYIVAKIGSLAQGPYVIKPDVFRALCAWVAPDGSLMEI